eukprot:scaffold95651_cov28-Attheya_sp.AAC.1
MPGKWHPLILWSTRIESDTRHDAVGNIDHPEPFWDAPVVGLAQEQIFLSDSQFDRTTGRPFGLLVGSKSRALGSVWLQYGTH